MRFPDYRPAGLSRPLTSDLRADLLAGLTVAIVALPLSMAIAIASGLGPERGLVTAIVGGFLVSLMGGTRHQIGGPAGAFIVLVSGCVAAIGVPGLILATAMSGVMLVGLGLLRLGGYIRFIPYPVIVGFTAGIGVIIFASQIKDLFGLTLAAPEPGELLHKIPVLWEARGSFTPASLGLAVVTIAIIEGIKRLAPRLPSLLIGVVAATLLGLALPVETIAGRFGALPAVLPLPSLPDLALWQAALPFAIGFTLLGAIESLLSAVVADQMAGTKMRADDELIGQGIANFGVALFGGFCVTGTIARTATNVRAGSRGPLSGMLHALILMVFLLIAAPLAGFIPLAALAGVLAIVSWNMIERPAIRALLRGYRGDALVLVVTFLLVVLRDLTEGITVGLALAGTMFIARMARLTEAAAVVQPGGDTLILRLRGPLFFGAVAQVESALGRIGTAPGLLVLDLEGVPYLDATGAELIAVAAHRTRHRGGRFVIAGASPVLKEVLRAHAEERLEFANSVNEVATIAQQSGANPFTNA